MIVAEPVRPPGPQTGVARLTGVRRAVLLAVSIVAAGGIAMIPGAGAHSAQGGDKARVKVVDYKFKPVRTTIRRGGKVVWAFKEGLHNVSGKGFKSRTQRRGTYSHTFKKVGTFKYRCTVHQPDMDGVVRVVR
jgi:plastocyanin